MFLKNRLAILAGYIEDTGVDYNYGSCQDDMGFEIKAICKGKVAARINNGQVSGFGNALIIETDGCPPNVAGSKTYHRYMHAQSFKVSVGAQINEGQVIGYVGNTGTDCAHLHLDVWTNRNGLGVHWNYDNNTTLASYEDSYRLIQNNPNWNGTSSLAGNQRIVGDSVLNQRREPTSSSELTDQFQPGEVLTFDGWINGETIDGNSKWFRGYYSGFWCWSDGLTDTGTHDLADLNPPPVTNPNIRVTHPDGTNIRKEPSTSSEKLGVYPGGTEVEMKGYVIGQVVEGSDKWFVVKSSSHYCHSSGFTDTNVGSLPNLTETPPVEPPEPPYEPLDPEMVNVSASDFPAFITYEEASDSDHYPDVNKDAYEYYFDKYGQDYKYYPIESHCHWWNDPNVISNHDDIVNYIKNTTDLSVDFVVSANKVTNFKALELVSYTTGARSMYGWKIEADPSLTEDVYKTLGCLHYIVEKKNPRLLDEPIRLHKEFMQTACSDIDVDKVREYADKFKSGELDFETGEPPYTPPECPECPECPDPPTGDILTQDSFDEYVRLQINAGQEYLTRRRK